MGPLLPGIRPTSAPSSARSKKRTFAERWVSAASPITRQRTPLPSSSQSVRCVRWGGRAGRAPAASARRSWRVLACARAKRDREHAELERDPRRAVVRDENVDLASLLEDADGVSFHAARCRSSSRSSGSTATCLPRKPTRHAFLARSPRASRVGVTTTSATAYRSSAPEKSAGDRHALSWCSALAAPERLSASRPPAHRRVRHRYAPQLGYD
jgi:hypothetical protein